MYDNNISSSCRIYIYYYYTDLTVYSEHVRAYYNLLLSTYINARELNCSMRVLEQSFDENPTQLYSDIV